MMEERKIEKTIEKTLKEQIIEKMISKLRISENFSDGLLGELEVIDLCNKNEVEEVISKTKEESENENIEGGN